MSFFFPRLFLWLLFDVLCLPSTMSCHSCSVYSLMINITTSTPSFTTTQIKRTSAIMTSSKPSTTEIATKKIVGPTAPIVRAVQQDFFSRSKISRGQRRRVQIATGVRSNLFVRFRVPTAHFVRGAKSIVRRLKVAPMKLTHRITAAP